MPTPEYYLLKLSELPADIIRDEVTAKKSSKASAGVFKDAIGQSIASVEIPVGKARAPHLHTNTSEIVSVTQGTGRVGLLTPSSGTLEFDVTAGEVCYFPCGWPHWIANKGDVPMKCFFNYVHEKPETIERNRSRGGEQ